MINSLTVRTEAPHPDVDEFTGMLQRMYQTGDLSELSGICAPELVAVYRKELETLHSYGLTKKIHFRSDSHKQRERGEATSLFFGSAEGKNDVSYTNGGMRYTEEFLSGGNRRVARFRHRRGFGELRAIRLRAQHQARAVREITCRNCGQRFTLQGAETACPACGAQYRHEAFHWLVTSFRLWNNALGHRLGWLFGGLFALAIIGGLVIQYRADGGFGGGITEVSLPWLIGVSVVILAVFGFVLVMAARDVIRMVIRNGRVERIKQRDPHFSRQALDLIANRVLDNEPALLGDAGPGETLLSGGTYQTYVADYLAAANHELVKLNLHYHCYRYQQAGSNGHADVQHEVKQLTLPLVRSWQARTPLNYVPTQFACPRCGSRQSITGSTHQQCTSCGSEFPLAHLDWALATDN